MFSHKTAQAHLNKPKLCQNYTRFLFPCQSWEKPSPAPGPGQGTDPDPDWNSSRFQDSSVVHSPTAALHWPAQPGTASGWAVCSPVGWPPQTENFWVSYIITCCIPAGRISKDSAQQDSVCLAASPEDIFYLCIWVNDCIKVWFFFSNRTKIGTQIQISHCFMYIVCPLISR